MSTDNWAGPSQETAWSEWAWNNEYQCDFRYRRNARGEWEYEYGPAAGQTKYGPAAGQTGDSIPRNTEDFTTYQAGNSAPTQQQFSNYQYKSYDDSAAALPNQFGSLKLSENVQGKGKAVASYSAETDASQNENVERRVRTRDPKETKDVDPQFKQHKSEKFYFGRIFKVLWSEPKGSGGTEITGRAHPAKTKDGEKVFSKVRRFLIVEQRRGHCLCLPILTYGGQGTLKYGAHPEDHAQIYTADKHGKRPPLLDGEDGLTRHPIKVEPISPSHKLDPASRINYAKVYTVEHNVKVCFIGMVTKSSLQHVVTDYNEAHAPLPDMPWAVPGAGADPGDDFQGTGGEDPEYHGPESGDPGDDGGYYEDQNHGDGGPNIYDANE